MRANRRPTRFQFGLAAKALSRSHPAGKLQAVQQHKTAAQPPPKENKITPPDQVLELVERFERNLDKYKQPDYKAARVRAEFIDPFLEKPWVGTCAMCKDAASGAY